MTAKTQAPVKTETKPLNVDRSGLLQRKCDCGKSAGLTGQCSECQSKQFTKQPGSIVQTVSAPVLHELIQPKLRVGEPGDKYEQEADRVADQVMRMPEPSVQRQMEPEEEGMVQRQGVANQITPLVQRQVLPEMEEEEEEVVQAKTIGNQAAPSARTQESSEVPSTVHEVLRSPGQPLDPVTRAFMEPRFGHDFSRVRVHFGGAAERSARDVDANAYTVGHDIVFGTGHFAPSTHEGQHLLAHELTHMVQQTGTKGNGVGQSNEKWSLSPITVQRAPANLKSDSENRFGSTLPYREAKNLADCIRIMGTGSAEYCRQEVLGEDVPKASPPTSSSGAPPLGASSSGKTARVLRMERARGCAFTITYSNLRQVDCDTAWQKVKGTKPPSPLCGASLVYDIVSVSASGSKCPANLDGLQVSELTKGDHGCTPPNHKWTQGACLIGPGGKVTSCTDTFTLCGLTSDLKGDCTEIVDQEMEVGGELAEEHEIIFNLKKSEKGCKGKVTRN